MGTQASIELQTTKEVKFTVQGELHTINASNDITPETTLNSYLRDYAGLKDTKWMCYEGGCGTCVVAATIPHPVTKRKRTLAVNSCLVAVLSCHGWDIQTVHGLGNRDIGYHPIQKKLVEYNGSQCGFCTGGMVMNMYALTQNDDMFTMQDIEDSFGGNLCRCTGYRSIMSAFKSLAIESENNDERPTKVCPKTGIICENPCTTMDPTLVHVQLDDKGAWYKVYSIQNILDIFQLNADKTYRLVAGNTGHGVYKITVEPDYWIDVTSVPELISHKVDTNLILGANVSLNDTMAIMSKLSKEIGDFWFLEKVAKHIDLVAHVAVRNIGTIAGNLSLKHDHHEFPSDIFLLLETIGAKLTIVEENENTIEKSVLEFINFDMTHRVLKSITIDPLNKNTYLFESYKICPRVQNAHAYVNAGFLIEHDNKFTVKSARIIYGGINPDFVHAEKTEDYLVNKILFNNETIQGALATLNDELKPDYVLPDATPEFRKNLAMNLFYKFILASADKSLVNAKYQSGGTRLERTLSTGSQEYQTDKNEYPVSEPIHKVEAFMQCSGEAQYVNDIPVIPNQVYGTFVLSNAEPYTTIVQVDVSEALKMPGVITFVDYKDIPGKNSFTAEIFTPHNEPLFTVDKVLYNGQPIGVIVACTLQHAINATDRVKVTYGKSTKKPEYTIQDVLKNKDSSKIQNVTKQNAKRKGHNTKHVIKGEFNVGPQYHFHMELQSCLCVPTDDGGYDMFPATQWINNVQLSAAAALNMPANKFNVSVKRIGGGYGGKILRANMVSTACAVASHKLKRPVRVNMTLTQNMKALGKRFPCHAEYEVGVDDKGVIQYMDNIYYSNVGTSGENEEQTSVIAQYMRSAYNNETWKLNGNLVATDMPGNCYTRGPGACEAIGMIETIMDQISYTVGMDPLKVRQANLERDQNNMPQFIQDMLTYSEYEKRKKEVDDFNKKNRWMKKGISFVPMNYHFRILGPYGVFVAVFAGDGSVAISHGGIECGQGINTKVIQVCAYMFDIPMDMITVKPSNELNAPNNFCTGGSLTSEAICYGIIKACKEILKRLEPVKQKMKHPTWKELVLQGYRENIEMCATHLYSKYYPDVKPYDILGACVTEVQVDILTGEHNIVRVDLMEDVGQSMNPFIDIGQIEGAFVMGLGYYTSENLIYDPNGQLLTNNTWTYKVPGVKDIPEDFRIKFRPHSTNPVGVLNSKAVAEPPLCLSISIPLAMRHALADARIDADPKAEKFIQIDGATTVEFTLLHTMDDYKKYSL